MTRSSPCWLSNKRKEEVWVNPWSWPSIGRGVAYAQLPWSKWALRISLGNPCTRPTIIVCFGAPALLWLPRSSQLRWPSGLGAHAEFHGALVEREPFHHSSGYMGVRLLGTSRVAIGSCGLRPSQEQTHNSSNKMVQLNLSVPGGTLRPSHPVLVNPMLRSFPTAGEALYMTLRFTPGRSYHVGPIR